MITGIFPIPLLIEKLDLKTDDIALYCRELRDKTKTADVSNRGGWHSKDIFVYQDSATARYNCL